MKKYLEGIVVNLEELYNKKYYLDRDYLPIHLQNAIENVLIQNNFHNILEVGVGTGRLMNSLRDKGYNVKGIDSSPIAAEMTGAIIGDATSIPFENESFDCVLGISIIEHLNEKDGLVFIKEIYRVLKKGGGVFLVTPNYSSPLRIIKGNNWYAYTDKTHLFYYTPKNLRNLLKVNGFNKIKFTFRLKDLPDFWPVEWPMGSIFKKLPNFFKHIPYRILISSPLGLYRDTFWIFGRKML
ncbi:MAG: class I SAM-dependent methyltransferase [Candidatus Acididesulfobacter guangdongensis]|uniref:Class I SAM-dependent methyltransferase n=1 Tax=Acididesulfobacter guangdongensis TaxID=2597225 RepID=A0A519BHX5_ACIG2|nr:MAG: class I SAM-dependent methyltransferase [Candidatus Acididesulfobacter guangdongensis]